MRLFPKETSAELCSALENFLLRDAFAASAHQAHICAMAW
jgi:hypothetical protein